ncbi:cation channel sperm-associated auxiliary subunit epsilon [Pteronotus mesoamericanus]|uniref:cation channel sperm-associated auxiliary subunit epsilon n=1 Tax=Pteronotus mesoamericanus TaxID=1884717 RepID=UPI0023EC7C28|nr:cation channel sperm-associated auxiliary subunit epsilon [Pteronotus parnellii mesoamericanus]
MAARGVAVLLSWLSCCGSALWRYSTSSPNYRIFSTRSTIKLEYEGTLFSEWHVPETCSVKDKSSPSTELRCSSPGIQIIRPIVTGPDLEEERYLFVGSSNTCFLWYYRVKNFPQNLTQIVVIWVYDPENADLSELLWEADFPSLNSIMLSKQLATLGQEPVLYTFLKRKVYFPQKKLENGAWSISIPMAVDDALKEIKGNQVAFQDCFVANSFFMLTFPLLTIPEHPSFLPISSPRGSQLMSSWQACVPSFAVVVSDMETFQTNDSFRTWTRIRVPPNALTDDERHSVSAVILSRDGIFFLINGVLYVKSFTAFTRLGSKENLPEGGIVGITSRKWCWVKYLLKASERRSSMAVWTRNEVYLGYTSLTFVKIITTKKLGEILAISPGATLTIHNVEYTGHPLELGLLLNYCITCTVTKKIHLVLYNEDIKEWVLQDFELNVMIDSSIILRFLHSAMPELILWDKHRIYYSYYNIINAGVLQTPTKFGNLSELSHNSIIHDVFIDYYGNIVVKMENNMMFFFKINIRDAVKLHVWANNTTKSLIFLNTSGGTYLVYVFKNGTIFPQEYPLNLEAQSIALKTKEKCPFVAFHSNILHIFYILDKGQNLTVWAQIVYPENIGLHIIVESYGPKILQKKEQVHYETALRYCTKTTTITFFQNVNYEAVDDYFELQYRKTGLLLVQVRPSEYAKTCPISPKVFQIAVGCDPSKYIAVKGFNNKRCTQHDLYYTIEKSYLRDRPLKNLKVKYNWKKYGCPRRLDFREKFHPLIQLYDEDGFIEDVEVNFIVWEIHGRDDYSFNTTMKKSGCLNEAQTWKSMTELNKHLPLEKAWGPENYKHCFSYAIGKPGDLEQPYEIMNKSNRNHLVWPMYHTGMYVFQVKILDPNYSFCNLSAIFAIEIFGVIPSPSGYLVVSFLFFLLLLFFSILVLSYFHYMRIYKQHVYEPDYKIERKHKNS